jgi:DinB superfamily
MDTLSFFLVQHGQLHSLDVATGASYADRVFAGLTDDQMRARPGNGLNSLIWLLWHMARTEDVAVNIVVSDGRQVLDDDWTRRMNVPWRTIGTGMTDADVGDLTARADVDAVRAYRAAVGRRTQDVVRALRPEEWNEMVGFTDTARAASAGAFAPNTAWVDGVGYKPWQGHSRAAQLAGSAIRHNAMHLGEAVTVRSLAGFALGI